MDALTKAEVLLIGGLIIAAVAFVGYEAVEHKEEIKELEDTGIVQSLTGLTIIKEVVKGVDYIEKGLKEDYDLTKDIFQGNIEQARTDYILAEYGDATLQWYQLFGADVYNTGLINLNVEYLRENAAVMAKRHGKPADYIKEVGSALMIRRGINGDWRISPFQIRQNIDKLPFSNELHGAFGSSASTLKSEIWTDFDRITEWAPKWGTLSESKRSSIKKIAKNDIALLAAMEKTGDQRSWIVEDRVRAWNEIFFHNKITL